MRSRDRQIRDIIARTSVTTQSELVDALRTAGIDVTQATVSRDIKRLGLVKVPDGAGRYRYQTPAAVVPGPNERQSRLRRAASEYMTDVDEGSGLIVVKTETGSAGTVAEAIDEQMWPEVVGTVAGDNTILVIPRDAAGRNAVLERLRNLL
jgi:transcriptional regulator of arginine metabolism